MLLSVKTTVATYCTLVPAAMVAFCGVKVTVCSVASLTVKVTLAERFWNVAVMALVPRKARGDDAAGIDAGNACLRGAPGGLGGHVGRRVIGEDGAENAVARPRRRARSGSGAR